MSATVVLCCAAALFVALAPLRESLRQLPGALLDLLSRRRGAATLATSALVLLVWWRAREDAALAALASRDLAPWFAGLEGQWLTSLQRWLGPDATRAAATLHTALPLGLVIGAALAPTPRDEPRRGVWILWSAAAIALPIGALVPLADPAAARLVDLAQVAVSPLDAARDGLVSLPLVALVAQIGAAARAGAHRARAAYVCAAAVLVATGVASGALWLSTCVLSCVGGMLAGRTARAALARLQGASSTGC